MASGDTLLLLLPQGSQPTTTNYAKLGVRNQHPILIFDGATNESIMWKAKMPQHYAGTTGVTVYIHYAMATETTNDIDWDAAFERVGDQVLDIDGDSFATVNSIDNTTVPGTLGFVDVVSITFTDGVDMDSVVAGDEFRLKVTRDAASDTSTGLSHLTLVEIQET